MNLDDDRQTNAMLATGALFALLHDRPGVQVKLDVADDDDPALVVRFVFLRSHYRLAVSMLDEPEVAPEPEVEP